MGWWQDAKDWADEQFNTTNPANNAYASVDQNNFNMPGYAGRDAHTMGAAQGAQSRGPFSSANDSTFRGDQMGLMGQMQGAYNNDDSSYALAQASANAAAARAQQRSLMSSASPNNAAMMARVGSQNIGRTDMGAMGQGMMGRLAERQGLLGQMSGLATNARGQDLQNNQFNAQMQQGNRNANDSYEQGMLGLNTQNAGMQQSGMMNYEQNRLGRFNTIAGVPTGAERLVKGIEGGVQTGIAVGKAFSDARMKQDIRPGHQQADQFMDDVHPYTYSYKNPGQIGMPPGQHTGVMAQDLERTPAGRGAVIDTPQGKVVDYGQLGGVMTASLASLNDRLKAIEENADRAGGSGAVAARTKQTISGSRPSHSEQGRGASDAQVGPNWREGAKRLNYALTFPPDSPQPAVRTAEEGPPIPVEGPPAPTPGQTIRNEIGSWLGGLLRGGRK